MRRLVHLLVSVALLAAAAAGAAADDVIVLENGREIRGRIVSETDDAVKIDIGGGKMTYRRSQIAEVRRERAAAPAADAPVGEAPAHDAGARREESSLVYVDGERIGVRTFRASKVPEGWIFEEELRVHDAQGRPKLEMRTTEHADGQYRPLRFQVRETDGVAEHRNVTGELVGGRLRIVISVNGERERKDLVAPAEPRFPFAAREMFLRESKALAGKWDCEVFDTRDGVFRAVSYREGGVRPLRLEDVSTQARVVVRRRGDLVEREWLGRDLVPVLAELNGPSMLTVATTKDAVERLRTGDTERVTGADSVAKTRYSDRQRGFSVAKPDPTWTFEKPESAGSGALVVVRNEPLFATVDVLTDPDARRDVKPEHAAEALQRLCRSVAPDFTVRADGWLDRGDDRIYWMEATATTRGEKTRTLARVMVKGGRVWRLLAACPEGAFAALRPDLEKILDSFRVE